MNNCRKCGYQDVTGVQNCHNLVKDPSNSTIRECGAILLITIYLNRTAGYKTMARSLHSWALHLAEPWFAAASNAGKAKAEQVMKPGWKKTNRTEPDRGSWGTIAGKMPPSLAASVKAGLSDFLDRS